jgi:DNA-binding CsgD family transcriptional regulator
VPTFVVYEGAGADTLADAVRARREPGIDVIEGWTTSRRRAPVLCVGRVETVDDAAAAVLAAVAGADLLVDATAGRDVIDRLCDDLRRLGTLEHRIGQPEGTRTPLTVDERAILAELLAGRSLGEAARALHISRRTADRRLASARTAVGAVTTSQALIRAQQLGVQPAGRRI